MEAELEGSDVEVAAPEASESPEIQEQDQQQMTAAAAVGVGGAVVVGVADAPSGGTVGPAAPVVGGGGAPVPTTISVPAATAAPAGRSVLQPRPAAPAPVAVASASLDVASAAVEVASASVGVAREKDCKSIYVGNLSPKVTEQLLFEIFQKAGKVDGCKVIRQLNENQPTYGFVDYSNRESAERSLEMFNGRLVCGFEVKVNWAFAANSSTDESTTNHFRIFVGDLSSEIDDDALFRSFSIFSSCSGARVMMDPNTNRSRGYGFVAFRLKEDAEQAISSMNGHWLGSRAIRCNWATRNPSSDRKSQHAAQLDYETVAGQTPHTNVTVYVGNLNNMVSDVQLRQHFSPFGRIVEVKMNSKGYAFVTYENHESAAFAIISMNGAMVSGQTIRCSWGTKSHSAAHFQQQPNHFQYMTPAMMSMAHPPSLAQQHAFLAQMSSFGFPGAAAHAGAPLQPYPNAYAAHQHVHPSGQAAFPGTGAYY